MSMRVFSSGKGACLHFAVDGSDNDEGFRTGVWFGSDFVVGATSMDKETLVGRLWVDFDTWPVGMNE